MSGFDEYTQHDATGLADLVRTKQVHPRELLASANAAMEGVGRELNCIVTRIDERARRHAQDFDPAQPFCGVPLLMKDLAEHVAGVRCTSGSRYERDFVPTLDAEMTRRFERAGFVLVGTTSTSELGLIPMTESDLHGPTENPWRKGHTAGGSSGGAGAAVAARIVPMAHGSDGGGSIRIPSACNGVFGLKPTRGRNPQGPGATERWHGFVASHVLTRSVRDSARALDATHGPELGAPYHAPVPTRPFADEVGRDPGKLRIAYSTRPSLPGEVHPDCAAAVASVAKLCDELGHHVHEADMDFIVPMDLARDFFTIVASETAAYYAMSAEHIGRPPGRGDLEPATVLAAMMGRQFTGAAVCESLNRIRAISARVAAFHEKVDVLLTPTLGMPPPKHFALRPRGLEARAQRLVADNRLSPVLRIPGLVEATLARVYRFIPYPPVANMTGQPAMSVPLFTNGDGLPIGTMFTGRFGDEATLLRLASQLETARPWADRRPQVCAR